MLQPSGALLHIALRWGIWNSTMSSLTQQQPAAWLTSLTSLSVGGLACGDAAAAAVAQLTRLRSLHWRPATPLGQWLPSAGVIVTVSGLEQLTALRGLTALQLDGWRRSRQHRIQLGSLSGHADLMDKVVLNQSPKVSPLLLGSCWSIMLAFA